MAAVADHKQNFITPVPGVVGDVQVELIAAGAVGIDLIGARLF
jgi:hypothetical protein